VLGKGKGMESRTVRVQEKGSLSGGADSEEKRRIRDAIIIGKTERPPAEYAEGRTSNKPLSIGCEGEKRQSTTNCQERRADAEQLTSNNHAQCDNNVTVSTVAKSKN